MTILVTGGTGTIGSQILGRLAGQGVDVQALTRDPSKAKFPDDVVPVRGDMLDVESMRSALVGASTLVLLNAVTPEELSQAVLTLNLAKEAGLHRVVYFSVLKGRDFTNVPHFAAKYAVEQMIEQFDIPATILRPNCFMQNDAIFFKDALLQHGVYRSRSAARVCPWWTRAMSVRLRRRRFSSVSARPNRCRITSSTWLGQSRSPAQAMPQLGRTF